MAQTEEQAYEVVQTKSDFEIRYYPPVMMAAYVSSSNDSSGFRSLFRYISGSNQSQTKIAMTTPVHMEKQEQGSSMAFVLPKKFDSKSTPLPSDSQVKVYEAKGGYYASIRYSGYTNESKEKNYTKQLKASLEKEGIEIAGSPKVFVYNSPFSFLNRRNEVSFPIVWKE